MSASAVKFDATALDVTVTEDRLVAILADGRKLSAPLTWFSRVGRDYPLPQGEGGRRGSP